MSLRRKYIITVVAAVLLTGCTNKKEEVDSDAIAWLQNKESADVADALAGIASVKAERESIKASSIAEEQSIEASISESIYQSSLAEWQSSVDESVSIENSISESIRESIEIQQSIEASIAESRYQAALEQSLEEEAIQASIEASLLAESIAQSAIAESIRQSAEQSSIQASIDQSIYESASIEASKASASAATDDPLSSAISGFEPGSPEHEYLKQLTAGTNLMPFGVKPIKDSDLYILHELFSHSVVVGDSRAEGAIWVLDESEVYYARGAHAASKEMHEKAKEAAQMYPQKALFWLGLNDMGIHGDRTDLFVKDYEALIDDFLSVDPTAVIYVQNMTPIGAKGLEKYPNSKYSDAYSMAIYEMCKKRGWHYLDANTYFDKNYYASDGLHYDKKYYMYWVQDAAVQMGLWGDKVK